MSQYSAHNDDVDSNNSGISDTHAVTKGNSGMRQSSVNELKRQSYIKGEPKRKTAISGLLMMQPFEFPATHNVEFKPTEGQALSVGLVSVSAALASDKILELRHLTNEIATLYAARAANVNDDPEYNKEAV